MLIIKHTIETSASPEYIWQIWQDVKNWNTWDAGLEYSSIDGSFVTGTKGLIKPKGGPLVHTTLASVEPLKAFVVTSKLFLAQMIVSHYVTQVDKITKVTHEIEMTGPLAFLFAFLIGRKMKKSLPAEMQAMVNKAQSVHKNESSQ